MKIGVDMDGVLADFTNAALRNIKKIWNIDIKYEDLKQPRLASYVYNCFKDSEKAIYEGPKELYKLISPPGFFENLEAYDGVIDTLKTLNKLYDVVMITKPLEWDHCPGEKYTWLTKHLGYHPKLLMVNSMDIKGLLDVDVMIDDDPRVIRSLSATIPIVVKRPWNEEFLKLEPIHSIDSFNEVPDVIDKIKKSLYNISFKGV